MWGARWQWLVVCALGLGASVMVLSGAEQPQASKAAAGEAKDKVAAPAEAAPEKPPEKAPAIPKITGHPTHVSLDSNIEIDEDGTVRDHAQSLMVSCNFKIADEPLLLRADHVRLSEAVTDTGENLAPRQQNDGPLWEREFDPGNERGGQDEYFVQFNLHIPARPAKKIRKMTGTIELVIADAALRQATLAPLKKIENRRIRLSSVADSEVYVARNLEQSKVRVRANGPVMARLLAMRFFGAGGTELMGGTWESGNEDELPFLEFGYKMPDDGKVLLVFYGSVRTVTAPFEIVDVPMPQFEAQEEGPPLTVEDQPQPVANNSAGKGNGEQGPEWVLEN